jgi:alkyl sulfatase BDS1-like metallo-beta-lactamase superfamily hydrolase
VTPEIRTKAVSKGIGVISQTGGVSDPLTPQSAAETTAAKHRELVRELAAGPRWWEVEHERATRGLVATIPSGVIEGPNGNVWDWGRYDFIGTDEAAFAADGPDTVNPALWRQAQLNAVHGLFEVAPGLWQVRGYDISNVTFIAGETGWIVIDPLTSEYTARAALNLVNAHIGQRPVVAVIYTHSHGDHFGGVLGVVSREEVASGTCRVIAPTGFLRETVAENVIGGTAMARRSFYQFGTLLPAGPKGHVDCGLGKAIPMSPLGLIAPTEDITHTGQELNVDGIRIVFQYTPNTEAPAEMNFFFPDHGWLCMAENCSQTMHNLVPIRGAQARDSLGWSKYIGESLETYGPDTQIMFTSHHWPIWGQSEVAQFLILQRDLYRWMHDQAMRLANLGYTMHEIAAQLELPPEFLQQGHTRGFYGDLSHNARAIYQRYLSFYDGNPAHLNPYAPVEAGKRYVEFMGGAEAVLAKARVSYAHGDFRWVVEVVNHVVFADPTNHEARALQANALEQLGYQSESSTFRNAYLTGAQELRTPPRVGNPMRAKGLLDGMSIEFIFDAIGVRLKAEEVGGVNLRTNWVFPDVNERWIIGLSNRALHTVPDAQDPAAAVTVTINRTTLLAIMGAETTFIEEASAGRVTFVGDPTVLTQIFSHLDTFSPGFAIVEP